jgi:FkbM family methyltransferase
MDVVSAHAFLADLIGKYKVTIDYEAVLEAQYRSFLKPDATIIDIGAHSGRHTRVFVALAPLGQVLAVEPLPDKANGLRQAFGQSIRLFEGALGETEGRAKFVWAQGTPEESGFRERHYNDPEHAKPTHIEVEVTTLDVLGGDLERCDFVKIDVEGAELTTLRGGSRFLDRLRPIVSVEFGKPAYAVYGVEATDLYRFAKAHRYRIHDVFLNPIPDLSSWLSVCDRATWDYFLIPEEKASSSLNIPNHQIQEKQSLLYRLAARVGLK